MLNSILMYLNANYPFLLLTGVLYAAYREVGAVAIGVVCQYFVNASSSFSHYAMIDQVQNCSAISFFSAAVPLTLFAMAPIAHYQLSQVLWKDNKVCNFLIFWVMFLLATSANYFVLTLKNAPGTLDAMQGSLLLAVLLAGAAVAWKKLNDELHTVLLSSASALFGKWTCYWSISSWAVMGKPQECEKGDQPAGGVIEQDFKPPLDISPHQDNWIASTIDRASPKNPVILVSSPIYLFNKNEFFIFRREHLNELEDLLQREPPRVIEGLHKAICRRLGRLPVAGDEHSFVRAYVSEFRRRLEIFYPSCFVPERTESLAA